MAKFNPKKMFEEIKTTPSELKSLLSRKSSDRKVLLYFSLAYLTEMYLNQAEEMMKKGRGMEADYFTGKSTQIREVTKKIFGHFPEKDVYTDRYEVPESWSLQTPEEEVKQMSQFCVSNLPQAPRIKDTEKLREVIEEKLSTYRKKGVVRKFVKVINSSLDRWTNPNKRTTLLELTFLLDNINEVLEAIKEEAEEETEEEEEELFPGIKKGENIEEVEKGDIEELK